MPLFLPVSAPKFAATLNPPLKACDGEKIEVGHRSVVDGQPQQDVTIVWRFAGVI